jgi:hypothetical protein
MEYHVCLSISVSVRINVSKITQWMLIKYDISDLSYVILIRFSPVLLYEAQIQISQNSQNWPFYQKVIDLHDKI